MKNYYLFSLLIMTFIISLTSCAPRTSMVFSDPATIYFQVTNLTETIEQVKVDDTLYSIYPNERRVIQFPIGHHAIEYKDLQMDNYFHYRDNVFLKIKRNGKPQLLVNDLPVEN